MTVEYGISGKWLELLKQSAPGVTRVAVLQGFGQPFRPWPVRRLQGAAPAFGMETPVGIRGVGEIERGLEAFARMPNGGMSCPLRAAGHRSGLAARHRLPAVYSDARFVAAGGLLSYGPDRDDAYRRAAGYVDRILKGEKPADLPVQRDKTSLSSISKQQRHSASMCRPLAPALTR